MTQVVEGPPRQLVESVAEEVARRVLSEHAPVSRGSVHVRKPHVAVAPVLRALGVKVVRRRGEAAAAGGRPTA